MESEDKVQRILLTGSSGVIGKALTARLREKGHGILRLVRSSAQEAADALPWNPRAPEAVADTSRLEGCDAAVHLAGANVAEHRWSDAYKRTIRESRVGSARALLAVLERLQRRPRVLVSASATGIYGERGDEVLGEDAAPGTDFLAEVCTEWEAVAAEGAARLGIRAVQLRFGVVLTPKGGALRKMLPVFRAGLGGRLGSGRQWISWVSLPDAVRAIEFALQTEASGAYNVMAPEPVTNAAFTRALAHAVHRPAFFAVPAFALRLAFGEMAQNTILTSTRAVPERLLAAGFQFEHPQLDDALPSLMQG